MNNETKFKVVFKVEQLPSRAEQIVRLDKVRNRKSYANFKGHFTDIVKMGLDKRNAVKILFKIDNIIDNYRGYHSERNSIYASESIRLLAIDNGVSKW